MLNKQTNKALTRTQITLFLHTEGWFILSYDHAQSNGTPLTIKLYTFLPYPDWRVAIFPCRIIRSRSWYRLFTRWKTKMEQLEI